MKDKIVYESSDKLVKVYKTESGYLGLRRVCAYDPVWSSVAATSLSHALKRIEEVRTKQLQLSYMHNRTALSLPE